MTLYRFRYEITYPWSSYNERKDIFVESRVEADKEIETYVKKCKTAEVTYSFKYMTESGPALEEIVVGERCLYRGYGGDLTEATIHRTTKNFLYIEQSPNVRFRRDGSEIDSWGKRHLHRYDQKMYDDYWKGRADRRRLDNMKRVDWLHIPDKLFDEIYAQLEAAEIVPHVDDVPVRQYAK